MKLIAIIFIVVYMIIIAIPCVGVGWIGVRLFEKLGRYPSKTPALQVSILVQLVVLEVVSFTLLLAFFKVLVAT